MTDLSELQKRIIAFRDDRNWKQFHNPKDVALSLVLEATEVLEHFQWKNEGEVKEYLSKHKGEVAEELADTLYWVLLMAHDLNIDLVKVSEKKLHKNEKKYPINKSADNHTKYDKL